MGHLVHNALSPSLYRRLDVGLPQGEDERVGERLEDDQDVPHRVHGEQRLGREV